MKKFLTDVCDICTGNLNANVAVDNGKYPFFTCAPQPLWIDSYEFDEDAILLAGNNAQGNFHINRYKGKFNAYQRTYVITAKDSYDIDYIKYAIEMSLSLLRKIAQGSQTKFLTMAMLENFRVEHRTYGKQSALIASVKATDRKIAVNNAINDNLQQQLKLMYDYWFTQFDFPNDDGKPYRASGGVMVYSEDLKRDIPQGWQVGSIAKNSLSEIIKPGVDTFEQKIYLATADVNGTDIETGNVVEYETRESRANMQPSYNSVWFAKMKNSVKHLYLNRQMDTLIKNSILSTGFCGLQCSEQSFEYMASVIGYSYFETIKNTLAHGATQEAVNNDDLDNIIIVVPSKRVLSMYHDRAKPLYSQISKNICENQDLMKLRDWLLPMLMNGQATIVD